ncbi:NAD(P)-dependent dehydrogenase (short-subunit alcohol dehydrogenase family) [Deinococcus metalli]|uniref:NAD(P)-dependent dehydrogenase (Short-subunit alcohol dehydrogenase family) n=1 Tax=Deinococcus metalli TaxID=1141878 RepID=A0A7W8KFI2_9DEIO|nr:SDR family NAD(P)-dependent oxidoreductase [Deinococcus metalli]MBB5376798.1 NAD(P)-dependent dehydrogenase (short-subunit alcohol dehydrogenase family) [Deinococcus metalli]GHF45423.1 hypothetical protein GCM10017781_22270 [Deinococcus metalli]
MTTHAPTALVTGATSGIGEITAKELARRGHTVLITARDARKGEATLGALRALNPAAPHEVHVGDLSVMGDVRRIALAVRAAHPRLDVLVNNAGGVFVTREVTSDGFERTLALNHLAYALMTELLLDPCAPRAPPGSCRSRPTRTAAAA